jgi:hypothetical protein
MKSQTEKKDNKADTDFFDWWDSMEARTAPAEKMPKPMDERARKTTGRA